MLDIELKNKIEDALIHFHDVGYQHKIYNTFYAIQGDNSYENKKIYDIIKKIDDDDDVIIGIKTVIGIRSKFVPGKNTNIMSYKGWQWFNTTLNTSIKRMTDDYESVNICFSSTNYGQDPFEYIGIEIPSKEFKFKNLVKLSLECRNFNRYGCNSNEQTLVITPIYDVNEGISLYLREVPRKSDFKKFDIFNENKEEILNFFNIEKVYHDDLLSDNDYLMGYFKDFKSIDTKHIIAKVSPKRFSII